MRRSVGAMLVLAVGLSVATVPQIAEARPSAVHPRWGHRRVCRASTERREAGCQSLVVTAAGSASPMATTAPTGYGPSDLVAAYGLPASTGSAWIWNGRTIAIVDAFDNPKALNDMKVYRRTFGLPLCTSANGCFKKVPQSAKATLPPSNVGWGQEIDLDLEMASAMCPRCKILLVEATSASFLDLGAAENRAAKLGATAISNSWGGPESILDSVFDGYFDHPGVAIAAAAGDTGYGTSYPASSPNVIAVGGTTLTVDPSTHARVTETAWSGGGSGCSDVFAQPAWQNGLISSDPSGLACANRTVADVAAVADPQTGVSVFDTFGSSGGNNWFVFGGTSVSTPLIAGLFASAGDATHKSGYPDPAKWIYVHAGSLFDVTAGSNATATNDCYPATGDPHYLCHAAPGFDGPTGLGTPNGTGAF